MAAAHAHEISFGLTEYIRGQAKLVNLSGSPVSSVVWLRMVPVNDARARPSLIVQACLSTAVTSSSISPACFSSNSACANLHDNAREGSSV